MKKKLLCLYSFLLVWGGNTLLPNTVFETYVELWNCSTPGQTSTCPTCANVPCQACSSACNSSGACTSTNCTTNSCSICYPVCHLYYGNTYLDMAFANYNGSGGTLAGTNVSSASVIQDISTYVQGSGGGKSKISFGGCTYPIYSGGYSACGLTATYSGYWTYGSAPTVDSGTDRYLIAENMAAAINNTAYYALNGADFDIEQPISSLAGVPAYTGPTLQTNSDIEALLNSGDLSSEQVNFAYYTAEIIGQVRSLCPSVILSLTIPGQATGHYWQLLAMLVIQNNFVDYVQFMEYDIYVNPGSYSSPCQAYVATIISDMQYYHTGWGIPYNKMSVGLMAGCDDIGNFLTTNGASCIAYYAIQNGLYGVMLWDMDIDYCQYNFVYQQAITNTFASGVPPAGCSTSSTSSMDYVLTPAQSNTKNNSSYALTAKQSASYTKRASKFMRASPPHGVPGER